MVEINREVTISIGAGVFLLFAILAYVMIPVAFPADTIILTNPDGGAPVSCLPSGGFVLAQNLTDLCDVTIVSPATNQIIEYNGTQWVNVAATIFNDTTTCTNIGTGTAFICVEGTNVDLRSLLAGTGISVSNSTNTVTITNTAPDNTVCANVGAGSQVYKDGECNFRTLTEGANIDLTQNTDDITIAVTGITPESTVCTNLGSVGEGVYASGNCDFKKLLAGSGISLSANGTRITITNTSPESTTCNNVGTGNQLCSGGNVNIDTIIAGTGITITDTTDDWTFASNCQNTGTGEAVCESSNNINSLIAGTGVSIADTSGDLTITNLVNTLNDLTDVIIISPTTNDAIRYNGTHWVDVNTAIWYDITNNIGTNTLIIKGTLSPIATFTLDSGGAGVTMEGTNYGGVNRLDCRASGGTEASPTILSGATNYCNLRIFGWDGSAFGQGAGNSYQSISTWNSTNHGMSVRLNSVADGTTTSRAVVEAHGDGTFRIGPTTLRLILSSSGLTAGRTFTFPDSAGEVTVNTATQTLTNKRIIYDVATKTADYTLVTTDDVILCNASGASRTLTLPTAVGNTGQIFMIKRIDSIALNTCTIDANGTQTIDNNLTVTLDTLGGLVNSVEIVSDGANWWIISDNT